MTERTLPRPIGLLEPAIGFSQAPTLNLPRWLARWLERRRERLALAELCHGDGRLLDDIGVPRWVACAEVEKPFWRP